MQMSSEKRSETNRANAQHSTGPKTEEGKAASSQNARKHGLSSKSVFIPDDRFEEFKDLHKAIFEETKPVGEIQSLYFEQMVHASWHTQIARELLTLAYHEMDERKINNFSRLLGQHERAFQRAHTKLEKLQTDLALRAIEENEPIAAVPMTCQIKVITNEATRVANQHERSQRLIRRCAALVRIGAAFNPELFPEPESEPAQEPHEDALQPAA